MSDFCATLPPFRFIEIRFFSVTAIRFSQFLNVLGHFTDMISVKLANEWLP
jgi:hypothetical protein